MWIHSTILNRVWNYNLQEASYFRRRATLQGYDAEGTSVTPALFKMSSHKVTPEQINELGQITLNPCLPHGCALWHLPFAGSKCHGKAQGGKKTASGDFMGALGFRVIFMRDRKKDLAQTMETQMGKNIETSMESGECSSSFRVNNWD